MDITFFRRNLFVSHYRKISLRTLSCFRKILTVKTCYGCEGGHHALPSKTSCLRLPKTFIGNILVLQKRSGCEKFVWMREGDMTFSRQILLNHSTGNFIGNSLVFPKFLGMERNIWTRRGYRKLPSFFLSHFTEKLLWELFGVSKNFLVAIILHGSERGISPFSVENFLYHSFEIFLWAPFVVKKNFWQRNLLKDTRTMSRFPSNCFCFRLPENFIRNSSVFQKFLDMGRTIWTNGGIANFCPFCLSHITEKVQWELFVVWENFWQLKHFMDAKEISRFSDEILLVHITEIFRCELFGASIVFWQRQSFMDARGDITFFRRNFFVEGYRKHLLRSLRCFKKDLVAKNLYGLEKEVSDFCV